MLSEEKLNFKSKMRVGANTLSSEHNIHALGLNHVCSFLDRVGFVILEVNPDPNHHYQLLTSIHNKSLLIAVRTAYAPGVGTLNTPTMDKLVRESEGFNALPYFAGLTVTPVETNDIEVEGQTDGQELKVIFNGMIAVHKSEILVANS